MCCGRGLWLPASPEEEETCCQGVMWGSLFSPVCACLFVCRLFVLEEPTLFLSGCGYYCKLFTSFTIVVFAGIRGCCQFSADLVHVNLLRDKPAVGAG